MLSWLSRISGAISSVRIPFVAPLARYASGMHASDKLIALVLGAGVVIASLLSLHALERMFLVVEPTYGGSLSEGVVGSPRFVNPLLALTDTDRDLQTLTYAGLMGLGAHGELVPVLAESYEISPEGTVYTFHLRSGIAFSDGTSVTADDVVYTVEKAQDPGLKSPELANWANVRAEAVDSSTVRFTLPKAYAPFIEDATLGILPAHLWRSLSNGEFPFSTLMTNPVGAGPFIVTNVHRSASGIIDHMTVSANPRFALGRPFLDSIHFTFFGQEKDFADALKGGRVESGYGVAKDGALAAPYAQVFGVFFNSGQNPLFARAEVRKALSLATDRDAIVDSVFGGFASPVTGPVPPGSGLAIGNATTSSEESLVAAEKTLTDAGWKLDEESGTWKQAKQKLELKLTLKTSNVPELKAVASALKEEWARLHVPVDIELYEPGDLTQNVIRPRKYEALLFGMVVGRDTDLYAFWDSAERNDPGLNIAGYANKSVDAVLEDMRTATDPAVRLADLAKAERLIAADYPAVFAYTPDFVYIVPKGVHGVSLPQIAQPADRFAGVWGWYREFEEVWPAFRHADSR